MYNAYLFPIWYTGCVCKRESFNKPQIPIPRIKYPEKSHPKNCYPGLVRSELTMKGKRIRVNYLNEGLGRTRSDQVGQPMITGRIEFSSKIQEGPPQPGAGWPMITGRTRPHKADDNWPHEADDNWPHEILQRNKYSIEAAPDRGRPLWVTPESKGKNNRNIPP